MAEHNIGKTIAELRKKQRLTQAELADKLSVTDKAVSRWESGAGLPGVNVFPLLATIFNVSIDYLMTGKNAELNIKLEDMDATKRRYYFIDHDDADNYIKYNYIKTTYFDEFPYRNEKTPISSIIQKKSYKIFNACVDAGINLTPMRSNTDTLVGAMYRHIDEMIEMACLSGSVAFLEKINFRSFAVGNKNQSQSSSSLWDAYDPKAAYLVSEQVFNFIYNDRRIDESVIKYISTYIPFNDKSIRYEFTAGGRRKIDGALYFLEQNIIEQLYTTKRFELLSAYMKSIRADTLKTIEIYENRDKKYEGSYVYYKVYSSGYLLQYSRSDYEVVKVVGKIIPISEKIIQLAVSNSDDVWLKKFMEYNKDLMDKVKDISDFHPYILSDDEIHLVEMKANPKFTDDEILIQKYTRKHITDIDAMLSDMKPDGQDIKGYKKWLNQIKHIEKDLIDKFYINKLELFEDLLEKNDFAKLFKISVDYKLNALTDLILKQDKKSIMDFIFKKFRPKVNTEILQYYRNIKLEKIAVKKKEIEDIIEQQTHIKKNKEVYDLCCSEINENYINNLVSKGDLDTAVIKLCVRLEATFRHKYQMDGDLFDMMDNYLSTLKHKDVERLYWEENEDLIRSYTEYNSKVDQITNNLHMLRKVRNSIVHPSDKISYSKENVLEWAKTIMEEI